MHQTFKLWGLATIIVMTPVLANANNNLAGDSSVYSSRQTIPNTIQNRITNVAEYTETDMAFHSDSMFDSEPDTIPNTIPNRISNATNTVPNTTNVIPNTVNTISNSIPNSTAPATWNYKNAPAAGSAYGPTGVDETLWSIASKLRPTAKVSIQQVLFAVYRSNPKAFENENIHSLLSGKMLVVPSLTQIQSASTQQAIDAMDAHKILLNKNNNASAASAATAKVMGTNISTDKKNTTVEKNTADKNTTGLAVNQTTSVESTNVTPVVVSTTASVQEKQAKIDQQFREAQLTEQLKQAQSALTSANTKVKVLERDLEKANTALKEKTQELANIASQAAPEHDESAQAKLEDENHKLRLMVASAKSELASVKEELNGQPRIEDLEKSLEEQRAKNEKLKEGIPPIIAHVIEKPWLLALLAIIPGLLLFFIIILLVGRRRSQSDTTVEEKLSTEKPTTDVLMTDDLVDEHNEQVEHIYQNSHTVEADVDQKHVDLDSQFDVNPEPVADSSYDDVSNIASSKVDIDSEESHHSTNMIMAGVSSTAAVLGGVHTLNKEDQPSTTAEDTINSFDEQLKDEVPSDDWDVSKAKIVSYPKELFEVKPEVEPEIQQEVEQVLPSSTDLYDVTHDDSYDVKVSPALSSEQRLTTEPQSERELLNSEMLAKWLDDEPSISDLVSETPLVNEDATQTSAIDFDSMLDIEKEILSTKEDKLAISAVPVGSVTEKNQSLWNNESQVVQKVMPKVNVNWSKQETVIPELDTKPSSFISIDELMAESENPPADQMEPNDQIVPNDVDNYRQNDSLFSNSDVDYDEDTSEFGMTDNYEDAIDKLNLAKIYIEMDDRKGAIKLLEKAMLKGDNDVRLEAKKLMDRLYYT